MPPPCAAPSAGRWVAGVWERASAPSALGYPIGAAHAGNHAAHQQKLPPALPAPRLPAQLIEVLPAPLFGFLVEPLEVPDRMLLDVFEVHGAALAHVEVEQRFVGLATTYFPELFGETERVVDPSVQSEGTHGVVQMRGVAGEQDPSRAEILRHALVHLVEALVLDLVALLPRQETLHAPRDHLLGQGQRLLLLGRHREDHAPYPRRPFVGHLE